MLGIIFLFLLTVIILELLVELWPLLLLIVVATVIFLNIKKNGSE